MSRLEGHRRSIGVGRVRKGRRAAPAALLAIAPALALLSVFLAPLAAAAQNEALVGSFRPYLHVLLAFGAAWLIIGAWVFRIGRKLDRLSNHMAEEEDQRS